MMKSPFPRYLAMIVLLIAVCMSAAGCDLSGKVACVYCKGSGKCRTCEGDGVSGGARYSWTCTRCGGDGRCVYCGGTGKVTKAQAEKDQKEKDADTQDFINGTGRYSGYTSAGQQSSSTTTSSYSTCSSCHETGTCQACRGYGYTELFGYITACSACRGTTYSRAFQMTIGDGRCPYCRH